jgi:hypothetical protein
MRSNARPRTNLSKVALRLTFVLPVLASLITSIAGGLVRAGAGVPAGVSGSWLTPAVTAHAFLMICTFMGTVIGLERAVAIKHPLAFLGPVASAAAGIAALCGAESMARWLVAGAAVAFVGVNAAVVVRQRAPHTLLLLVGACAWAVGCLFHAMNAQLGAVVPLWFGFLVFTIAAERLEMTRLMRRRPGAAPALYAILGAMLLGAAHSGAWPAGAGVLFGLSLSALAVWLVAFDIARRTVRTVGLSRYMAVCLLLGYGWLFIAGTAWVGMSLGLPWRDAALHALGLGFVFSMMLGHAPVILPAIARLKVLFSRVYYVPLFLLHVSLVVRVVPGHVDYRALAGGAAANALAIAAFAATVAGSAVAWRIRHPSTHSRPHHGVLDGH